MNMQAKYRTFRGGNRESFTGLHPGQRYLIRCTRRDDGQVVVALEYPQPGVKPVVVSEQQFEQWWTNE